MMSIGFNSISILHIHDVDYCCIIVEISKSEATHLFKNADLKKNEFTIKGGQKKYNIWWYWNQKSSISNNKIKKSNWVSFGKKTFKYVIGYKDDGRICKKFWWS